MRRATTPTHIFTFPNTVGVATITEALIIYSQCGQTVLKKTLEDLTVDNTNNAFSLTLTQKETNLFAPGEAIVQFRAKVGETSLASQMILLTVKPVLNSEEM